VHRLSSTIVEFKFGRFESGLRLFLLSLFTADLLPLLGDVPGFGLVLDFIDEVTSSGNDRDADYLNRISWPCFLQLVSSIILHRLDFGVVLTDDQQRSCLEDTLADDDRGRIEALMVLVGLQGDALALPFRVGFELFCFLQDQLRKQVHILTRLCTDMHNRNISSPGLDIESSFEECLFDALDVGIGEIDLVDGHDGLNLIFVDDVDNFLGLLLDSFGRRNDQHDEVSNPSAPSAHVAEGLVSGCIDEGDFLIVTTNVKCTYFLSDTAHFSFCNVGVAQVVDERGLAVVNVTHNGDHR
jgi:hypothetical protein